MKKLPIIIGVVVIIAGAYLEINQYLERRDVIDLSHQLQLKIDSLNSVLIEEREQWHRDSLLFADSLSKSNDRIHKFEVHVDKIDFRGYPDSGLDSLVDALYLPGSGLK